MMMLNKKTISLTCLLLLGILNIHAQYLWQIKEDTIIKWYYEDGDEFNGKTLNRDKWNTGLAWGRTVMTQDLYFTDGANIQLENGLLKLSLKKSDTVVAISPWEIDSAFIKKEKRTVDVNACKFKYTAGLIWSKRKFKYGYFEIRFKCAKQSRGLWPAFWMFNGNKNDEIDFMEMKGERRNELHVDVHCPDGCANYKTSFGIDKSWGGWVKTDNNFDEGYNTLAGEWQNGYVKWYLNGRGIAYFPAKFVTAMNIIANTSVAKDKGAFPPGPDNTTVLPGLFEIDYIRVWTLDTALKGAFLPSTEQTQAIPFERYKSNDAKMKKKNRLVYNKTAYYNNDGITVSLLPEGTRKYALNLAGRLDGSVTVNVKNEEGRIVYEKHEHKDEFLSIEFAHLSPGKYTFVLEYKNKRIQQQLTIGNL